MIRWEICKCQILSLIFVFTDYVIHPESPGVKFQMQAIGVGCRLEMLEWNKCDQQSERVCSGWKSLQLGKSARTGNAALNEVNPKVLSFVLTRAFKNSRFFFFLYVSLKAARLSVRAGVVLTGTQPKVLTAKELRVWHSANGRLATSIISWMISFTVDIFAKCMQVIESLWLWRMRPKRSSLMDFVGLQCYFSGLFRLPFFLWVDGWWRLWARWGQWSVARLNPVTLIEWIHCER